MKSLLISRCLLGEKVRYDGGDCLLKENLLARISIQYKLIPICPEVMAKMEIPRDPIEILNGKIIDQNNSDLTSLFNPVKNELKTLVENQNIQFALLKDFSPSCGVTQIYSGHFDGKMVDGVGHITAYLTSLGIRVYSEQNIELLLNLK